jgi:CRP/FNR family cyclic AMP-dependent transcriptional regulator
MTQSSLVQALTEASLLAGLPAEHLAQLAATARRRTYRRGEVIFHQGDVGNSLHVLVSGAVKVVNDAESGDEAVLFILGPGDTFGELSLLDGEPRSAGVEAMEPVETVMLDRAVFLQYLAEHPEMLMPVTTALCGVIRRLTETSGI